MPVIAAEWTVDPNGALPPTQDPRVPGLFCAKVGPDSDCQTSYQAGSEAPLPGDEDDLTGLDLHVSPSCLTLELCEVVKTAIKRQFAYLGWRLADLVSVS